MTRAEALLREAIQFDQGVAEPRIQLARILNGTRPEEADRVIDDAIAANPQWARHSANSFLSSGFFVFR